MATSTKKKMGRPTRYSHELAEKICDLIRSGKSERQICAMKGMPDTKTLWAWKEKYPDFLHQSARARADSADFYNDRRMKKAEELYEIAQQHLKAGESIPKGVVEAIKVSIQEDARESGLRDDSRYGDRKRVALIGADGGAVKVETRQQYDLSNLSVSDLEKLEAILNGINKSSDAGGSENLESS